MRKTGKHAVYAIEEKNQIVRKYLNGEIGVKNLLRQYDISSKSVLYRWVSQYRLYGTCVDGRGKSTGHLKGRPKIIRPKEMTKEELIQYVEAMEDIKKSLAYLRKQKRNIW